MIMHNKPKHAAFVAIKLASGKLKLDRTGEPVVLFKFGTKVLLTKTKLTGII